MNAPRQLASAVMLSVALAVVAMLHTGKQMNAHALAVAGPPWISIETPVNPYDPSTKDAYLVVHAFHHNEQLAAPVSGTAEGLVDGERRSVALAFTATSRPGAYALRKQWGDTGIWTLVITVTQHENDVAQALVDIGLDGSVSRVQVPSRIGERNYRFPNPVSARDVDAALRLRARSALATK